jgi:hypothetical protein
LKEAIGWGPALCQDRLKANLAAKVFDRSLLDEIKPNEQVAAISFGMLREPQHERKNNDEIKSSVRPATRRRTPIGFISNLQAQLAGAIVLTTGKARKETNHDGLSV